MMKAQLEERPGELTIHVCGRLAEGYVQELEKFWNEAVAAHPGVSLSVDLRCVTFIDQAGKELLRRMHSGGADLVAAGLRNQELVNQVTGGSK